MPDHDFDPLLARAVNTVLETMFFTAPFCPAEEDAQTETVLHARVAFEGDPSGTLRVRISEASARSLAAAFLGEEEESLSQPQIGQVVCELANMLCGFLVSQLEAEKHFDLRSPELLSNGSENRSGISPASQQSFAIESGLLTVALYMDFPHEA